jgi:zinc protease
MKRVSKLLGIGVLGLALTGATASAAPASGAAPARSATPVRSTAPAPVAGIPPVEPPQKVRSLEGIDEYTLSNGLRVLLFPDDTQSTVTVNITYFVGSKHEGYGETGMAHLLEHMLFKGTPTHRNVLKLLDERGAFMNGTTWMDRTNYFETLNATEDNLRFALELEADRMINASISKEDLASEFSVVRNELEAGENDPESVLSARLASMAFIWHNYGKDTIGSRSDVENVPADRLRAFYSHYYQPDNAMLVVSGKFDAAWVLAEVQRTFGTIRQPTRKLMPSYTVEPVQDGERSVVLRRTGDVHVAAALYHGVHGAHADYPATEAIVDALTREPSGRLYQALVVPGIAAEVSGYVFLFRDPAYMYLSLSARDAGKLDKAKKIFTEVTEGLATRPITTEELERWRAATLKELRLALADSGGIAVGLSEWAAAGDWRLLFAYRDRVKSLTLADVNRVARDYLKSSNRTSGEFIPTKAPERAPSPVAPDIARTVAAIVPGKAINAGEVFDASLPSLIKRTEWKELKGGIKAALLPKSTRGGKVQLTLTFHVSDAKGLADRWATARMAAQLAVRGTRTRSYQQIEDEKDRLVSQVHVAGFGSLVHVYVETVREHVPAVIDLVADVVKNPRFDPKELEVVRQEQLAELESNLQDPQTRASIELHRWLSRWPVGHPLHALTLPERISATKKVKVAEVVAFHRDSWGAKNLEVAVVGDFDSGALIAKLEEHFATWRARRPYERIIDEVQVVPAGELAIDTKDKEMAIVVASHRFALRDDHPDHAALQLASNILGASAGSRLWMRLREKDGMSYGAWGTIGASSFDPVAAVHIGAILAPQNLAKGKAAIIEEVTKLVSAGVTDAEVAVARKQWLEQLTNIMADDRGLMSMLGDNLELGRRLQWQADLAASIGKVTAADVNRVLKTYLDPRKLVLVMAGDLAKTDGQIQATP